MPEANFFTPKQYIFEVAGFENTIRNFFKGPQTAWNKFLKPAVNVAAPFIGMALSAKTKKPKVGQPTTNILKSISGGNVLSLTDILRCWSKITSFVNHFKDSLQNK